MQKIHLTSLVFIWTSIKMKAQIIIVMVVHCQSISSNVVWMGFSNFMNCNQELESTGVFWSQYWGLVHVIIYNLGKLIISPDLLECKISWAPMLKLWRGLTVCRSYKIFSDVPWCPNRLLHAVFYLSSCNICVAWMNKGFNWTDSAMLSTVCTKEKR